MTGRLPLNGRAATVTVQRKLSFAALESTSTSLFNLELTVPVGALVPFSGDLTVIAAVSEPETHALQLPGFGAVGFMACRREFGCAA